MNSEIKNAGIVMPILLRADGNRSCSKEQFHGQEFHLTTVEGTINWVALTTLANNIHWLGVLLNE